MRDQLNMMIVRLADHFPLRVSDWACAMILTLWGLIGFYVSPQTWGLPIYSGLSHIAPQVIWVSAATFIGLSRLIALFINGAIRRTPHVRAVGAFLAVFVWLQISLGLLWSDALAPSLAVYPVLFIVDIYNVYRASEDARRADIKHRYSRGANRNAASAEC